jgi:hypothetical protein
LKRRENKLVAKLCSLLLILLLEQSNSGIGGSLKSVNAHEFVDKLLR